MTAASFAEHAEFACRLAAAAGDAVLPHFRRPIAVEDKGGARGYDPVTAADRAAEAVIRAGIAQAFPEHSIVGEEDADVRGSSPFTWVIDPIDGTRSFILGQLHWGILIALHDGTRPVAGVMHQPFVGETFVGAIGMAAQWRRGGERRTLRTRACPTIEQAIVATTDPRHFDSDARRHAYSTVTDRARLTRFGGDCYCYTQLAMGLTDVVIETGLQPYDIQALIAVIEAAGGVVTDWRGRPCDQGGDVLACGDRSLHASLVRAIGH